MLVNIIALTFLFESTQSLSHSFTISIAEVAVVGLILQSKWFQKFGIYKEEALQSELNQNKHLFNAVYQNSPYQILIADLNDNGKLIEQNLGENHFKLFSKNESLLDFFKSHLGMSNEQANLEFDKVYSNASNKHSSTHSTRVQRSIEYVNYYDLTIIPMHAAYPGKNYVALMVRDITAQKEMELEHRYSEDRLKIASETAREGIWDWDLSRSKIICNDIFFELIGEENRNNEISPKIILKNIFQNDRKYVLHEVKEFLNNNKNSFSLEYRIISNDSKIQWMLTSARVTQRDSFGLPSRIVGTIFDIDKFKQAERRLGEQNKRLREFAFYNSHKLRAPLANILGLLPFIENMIPEELHSRFMFSAKKLDTLIHQMDNILTLTEDEFLNLNIPREVNQIVMVDDDAVTLKMNKKIVSKVAPSANITTYDNPQTALKAIQKKEIIPDILFLDVHMPEMSGWDFLDQFSMINRSTKVYVLTSDVNNQNIGRSKHYELVKALLSKPLRKETFENILNERDEKTITEEIYSD